MNFPMTTCCVLLFFVFGVKSCSLTYKDCGSKGAKVVSVSDNATDCGNVAILKRGTFVQLNVTLAAAEVTAKLTADVHGKIGPASIPFPLGNPDACKDCNIDCPVQNGKQYSYLPVIEVKTSYPGISLVVEWVLKDDNNSEFFCIALPAKIV